MFNIYKQKPLPFSFLVLLILILLHIVGSYYYWYWQYSGFDTIVHIFSGLWVALVIIWLAVIFGQINSLKEYKVKIFLIALVSALLFGVIWELLENISRVISVNSKIYNLNTAKDIISDGVGGVFAYLYFIRKKKCASCVEDLLPWSKGKRE